MGTESHYCIKKCKPCDYNRHVWGATEPDCEKCERELLGWTEEQRLNWEDILQRRQESA